MLELFNLHDVNSTLLLFFFISFMMDLLSILQIMIMKSFLLMVFNMVINMPFKKEEVNIIIMVVNIIIIMMGVVNIIIIINKIIIIIMVVNKQVINITILKYY